MSAPNSGAWHHPGKAEKQYDAATETPKRKRLFQPTMTQALASDSGLKVSAHNEWAIRSGQTAQAARRWRSLCEAAATARDDEASWRHVNFLKDFVVCCSLVDAHPVMLAQFFISNDLEFDTAGLTEVHAKLGDYTVDTDDEADPPKSLGGSNDGDGTSDKE